MIVPLAYVMLFLGLGPAVLYVFGKIKDPLHPLIVMGAASYFVSAHSLLKNSEPAAQLLGESAFTQYLIVAIISLLGFYLGWRVSFLRDRGKFTDANIKRLPRDGSMIAIAAFCAIIGVAAFIISYRQYTLTGYLRDLSNLWITAAILSMLVISKPGDSPYRKHAFVVLAIAFIPPMTLFWTYGQRGDTIRIALIVSIFYLVRGIRPLKPAFMISAFCIALVLATLAQTREIIKDDPTQNRITALAQVIPHFFQEKTERYSGAEEFIFGAGLVEATRVSGNYEWGRGWTLRLVSRFAPKEIFADKWNWFGTSLADEFNTVREHFGLVVPMGSAISGVAEGFAQLGWACPLVWFILGFIHQKLWYRTKYSARRYFAGYLTAFNVAMLYAILQDIYTAEMNMIYVLAPLYLSYRFASVPVEEETSDYPLAEAGSASLA